MYGRAGRGVVACLTITCLAIFSLASNSLAPQRLAGQPGTASIPGEVSVRATFENLGVRWAVEGDSDLDGRVTLRFREARSGESGSAEWRQGLPLVRSHRELVGEGGHRPDSRWAGSVFWLKPGTEYEIELSLTDPDGGGETRLATATTRTPITPAADARERYVIPAPEGTSGGGLGSVEDPFRGLQAAADAAEPNDLIHVAPGQYAPFEILKSGEPGRPIVFMGPDDGFDPDAPESASAAVIDGGGIERGIVTLGRNDRTIAHVMFERMTLLNGAWGIDAQHSRDITVRHVIMSDVSHGYTNRRGDADEMNQTICDSVFLGRVGWPGEGIPSEQAIDVQGDGNVLCHNLIANFGDGVSAQPNSGDAWGNDIYGNDITRIVDDPIEIDYNNANVRVWSNRVTNGRMGISVAPIYGGPAYVMRNTFFNLQSSAYKMNREPAGLVILHNTSLKRVNGTSSPARWQNTFLRNNFLFGTRYIFEEYGIAPRSVDDWDHDALAREPGCGGDTPPCFKWDDVRYATLEDLQAGVGIERNGIMGSRADLMAAPLPEAYETEVAPDVVDLRLNSGAPEIDAGAVLANVNDPWVTDGRPDIGAFELGSEMPAYGPRPVGSAITFLGGSTPSIPTPSTPTSTAPPEPTSTIFASTVEPTAEPTPGPISTGSVPAWIIHLPILRSS